MARARKEDHPYWEQAVTLREAAAALERWLHAPNDTREQPAQGRWPTPHGDLWITNAHDYVQPMEPVRLLRAAARQYETIAREETRHRNSRCLDPDCWCHGAWAPEPKGAP